MYTQIVIPLDGSQVAEQVLPYARFLAKKLAIPVHLLQVIDPDVVSLLANPGQGRYIDTIVDDLTRESRAYLESIAKSIAGKSVQCLVEKGKAEDILIEQAAADKDSLMIMATHGRSGIQRWLLGSVADKVLHGATNHVFLIRATDQGKSAGESVLKTVVVPLDGSPLAEQVLPHVADLAKRLGLQIILTRAYALPSAVAPDAYGTYTEELINQLETETREYLAGKIEGLKEKGLENITTVPDFGYGAEEIIKLARQTPDNFIAMCSHGRSGIRRWVLGSVTERVVQHSGDPVLIIRAS